MLLAKIVTLSRSPLTHTVLWNFAVKAASIASNFLVTVVLARLLGVNGYGVYAYAYTLVILLATPVHAGLPLLVLRETAQSLAKGQPERVRGVWRWSHRMAIGLSLAIVIGLGPWLVVWHGGLSSEVAMAILWALPLIPLVALCNLNGAAVRGLKRVAIGQFLEFVLRPSVLVAFVVGLAITHSAWLSAANVMALHTLAAVMTLIVAAGMLWQYIPANVRLALPKVEPKGWLGSSLTFALVAGFNVVNNQASTVMVGMITSSEAVGQYKVAIQMATLAAFGLQAINMVMAPRFAELWASNQRGRLQQLVTCSAQIVFAFNLLVTLIFVIFGRSLLTVVFGVGFAAAYAPLIILLLGQMVNALTGSVGVLLNMTGHERDAAWGIGIAVATNLLLHIILVPSQGMIGAAVAMAASMVTWNVLLWWLVRQRLGLNSLAFVPTRKSDVI